MCWSVFSPLSITWISCHISLPIFSLVASNSIVWIDIFNSSSIHGTIELLICYYMTCCWVWRCFSVLKLFFVLSVVLAYKKNLNVCIKLSSELHTQKKDKVYCKVTFLINQEDEIKTCFWVRVCVWWCLFPPHQPQYWILF